MIKHFTLLALFTLALLASGHIAPTAAQQATAEATPVIAETPEATADAASFPVTLDTLYGPVEIKTVPQRVVALSTGDADAAFALGVIPVMGVEDRYSEQSNGIPAWLQDQLDPAKTELLPDSDTLPLERILAIKPDVILATSAYQLEKSYDSLKQIAPVVSSKSDYVEGTWQERLLLIGRALGREKRAQQIIDETDARIEALTTNHPAIVGKTFTLSYAFAPGQVITINSTDDYAFRFFNELGLTIPEATTTGLTKVSDGIMSYEQFNLLDADLMIIAFDNADLQKDMETNPLFQRLNAVQNGTYFPVTLETIAAMRSPSVLGISWLLPQIEAMLTKISA